jgi:hypothetical protein
LTWIKDREPTLWVKSGRQNSSTRCPLYPESGHPGHRLHPLNAIAGPHSNSGQSGKHCAARDNSRYCCGCFSSPLLLRMFLVADHLTVGILFFVYLFLLGPCQIPAIGFDVCVLLLLDGAIIGP